MEFEYRNSKVITEQTKIRDYLFNFYACLIISVYVCAKESATCNEKSFILIKYW